MPNYTSTIKTRGFLYLETKKAATLLFQGLSPKEIKKKSVEDNLFLMKSENRKQEIATTVLNRLNALDNFLIKKIINGDLVTSKLLVLYTIIKTDQLFYEFMHEVFAEKLIIMDNKITARDIMNFFQRKSEQSEQVARWADYTHYKLGQVYRKILIEAGIAKAKANKLLISRPVFEKDVAEHIKTKGDQHYLNVMIGGR
jgi:hypothetical protein